MLRLGAECDTNVARMAMLVAHMYGLLLPELHTHSQTHGLPVPSAEAVLFTSERLVGLLVADRQADAHPGAAATPLAAKPPAVSPSAAPAAAAAPKANGAGSGRKRKKKAFCGCRCKCYTRYSATYQGCECDCEDEHGNPCGCQNPGPLSGGPMALERIEGQNYWIEK